MKNCDRGLENAENVRGQSYQSTAFDIRRNL